MSISEPIASIPFLGSGLGFRRELRQELLEARDSIDFVEIITEQYSEELSSSLGELEEICDAFTVIPHGVSLSIGSMGPLDMDYLAKVKKVSDVTRSPYYSEHLCMTRVPGIDIGHLSPLWFTEELLANTIRKVHQVQDYLEKPLILENVTYTFEIPKAAMSQTDFFNRLVDATGCGVLLDVTNVFINSVNHDFDAEAFMDAMPLDRVVQVHLAGGYWSHGLLIDGHSETVQPETWKLLEKLVTRTLVKGSILEHDSNFPQLHSLLETVERARRILSTPALERLKTA